MKLRSTYFRIKTAVVSRKKSAYFGMFTLGISPITRIIDNLFSNNHNINKEIESVVLIVCPPRSGGTIIYQVITYLIPCLYLSNLHQMFPNLGSLLLKKRLSKRNKKLDFNNYYGYSFGFTGVNEGNALIQNIYSKGTEKIRSQFIKFYSRMVPNENKALIFKNVRHYDSLQDLCKAVPELKIIRVKRDFRQVVQSEFLAYKKLKYFHPIPDSLKSVYNKIEPEEFAVRQIMEMEKTLDNLEKSIDSDRFLEIKYEEFCSDPKRFTRIIMEKFLKMDTSNMSNKDLPLKASFSKKLSDEETKNIDRYISALI